MNVLYVSSGFGSQPAISTQDVKVLSQDTSSTMKPTTAQPTTPTRLIIPSVNIGISIDPAVIDTASNSWPLSDTNAQYATFTPGLGNTRGTMLLYGHNTWPVMRNTADLDIGDEMMLVDDTGKSWKFVLEKEEIVQPEQVGFIYEDVAFRVVIFTCNGWNDATRRLMFFKPI